MSKPSSSIRLMENFAGRTTRAAYKPMEGDLHSGEFFFVTNIDQLCER